MNRIYTKSYINNDPAEFFLDETLFHNANGYLGVRGSLCEGVPDEWNTMRGTYINGFYDTVPMKQAENLCNFVNEKQRLLNVADVTDIVCFADGHRVDITSGEILEHSRSLNMDRGVTERKMVWRSASGRMVQITSKAMASFVMSSLFCIEYTVKAIEGCCEIEVDFTHNPCVSNYSDPGDPRTASEVIKNLNVVSMEINGNSSTSVSKTTVSGLEMCSLVNTSVHESDSDNEGAFAHQIFGNKAVLKYSGTLNSGESVSFRRLCVFTDSIRCGNVKAEAVRNMENALQNGLDYYYSEQEYFLSKFWERSAMEIDGDDGLNMAVNFNMYELLQSSAVDDKCSIAAKGLSGEGYEGHYFWDTEIFVLPFFIMTNPSIAKSILAYRYTTLDKARENALLLGHSKGALYPWRTITGAECSGYFVSGSAAYHIDADIAFAITKYYFASGDEQFLADKGEEILIETARLWLDVGNYNRDGNFVINEVTGPDEYTCLIDNNFYTNCAAKHNLIWAVRLFRLLDSHGKAEDLKTRLKVTYAELEEMEKAAENMLIPYDQDYGINPQDDSFLSKPIWDISSTPAEDFPLLLHYHPLKLYRYQVCKQADTILAYFMFDHGQSKDVVERSFRYYEKITTHDSSLSKCVFSIVASMLSLPIEAYNYFGDSAKLDLENMHCDTRNGIHTANMGGSYMAIVNGFSGVIIDENGLSVSPNLPYTWNRLSFNIIYLGSPVHFDITRENVSVVNTGNIVLNIAIYGHSYILNSNEIITVKCEKK